MCIFIYLFVSTSIISDLFRYMLILTAMQNLITTIHRIECCISHNRKSIRLTRRFVVVDAVAAIAATTAVAVTVTVVCIIVNSKVIIFF